LVYDTANFYTKSHSEKIIGDFIAQDRARRERMVLATKFFGNLYLGDPNGGGAGRKAILAQCEQSLRRLQTDYIDLYWLHMNDRFTEFILAIFSRHLHRRRNRTVFSACKYGTPD
jgi:aryl-alcohol dehydrogenase-like predicted oxidoreductase